MLLSPRHEQFAQKVASGASAAQAYRETYPNARPATAETNRPALLRRKVLDLIFAHKAAYYLFHSSASK